MSMKVTLVLLKIFIFIILKREDLKKTILNAQIWALKVEGRWDKGGKKKIKAKKVGQL